MRMTFKLFKGTYASVGKSGVRVYGFWGPFFKSLFK